MSSETVPIERFRELVKTNEKHYQELCTLRTQVEGLTKQAKIDNEVNQDWINSLCSQLCKMEDALGFKNDCYDKKGKWIPTIGPWLERVRDLLAAEGELGDAKEELMRLRTQLAEKEAEAAVLREALNGWRKYFQSDIPTNADQHEQQGEEFNGAWHAMDTALSTSAGKAYLARMEEAVRLLSRAHPGMHTCETGQWFTDRDALLEQLKGGVE